MKLVFTLLSLITSPALAVTAVQQNLIPAASQNEVMATLELNGISAKSSSDVDIKGNGAAIAGSYYYGFTENQALGLNVSAASTSLDYEDTNGNKTNAKQKGLHDIQFRYKGNFEVGTPTLFVSGGFNLSPENKTTNFISSDEIEYNYASGAHSLSGLVGLIFPTSIINYGFTANYTHQMDGKYQSKSGGFTADLKGGSSYKISALVELVNFLHPNFSLNYQRVFSSAAQSTSGNFSAKPQETLGLTGSMRISLSETVELLPYATFSTILNKDEIQLDRYAEADLGITGRFLF